MSEKKTPKKLEDETTSAINGGQSVVEVMRRYPKRRKSAQIKTPDGIDGIVVPNPDSDTIPLQESLN